MAAINDKALSKFVGILEVAPQATPGSLVRVGSVRGLVAGFDNTAQAVDIKADDTGTVFKGYIPEVRFEGSFLENADRDLIKLLLGGSSSNVAGALVAGATQVIANPFVAGKFYPITNQNGSGAALVVNSVTGGTDGALTVNDDFIVTEVNGIYGIVLNTVAGGGTLTTLAQTITINYDYTPNTREDLTFPLTFTEVPRIYAKITCTDPEDSNTRIFILDDASFKGTYNLEALDVVEAGDLVGTTFVIEGNKGSNYIIQNEIL